MRRFVREPPEFIDATRAQVIAHGRMLMIAKTDSEANADTATASFLALLAQEMTESPERIKPMGAARKKRIAGLTEGIATDLDEDLGAEALF